MTFQETVTVTLGGGRPWGFSVKGGLENNRPLVISKIEKDGKAEEGGLCLGDILYAVNGTSLHGYRDEAVQLVRAAKQTLAMQIKRNKFYGDSRMSMQLTSTSFDNNFYENNLYVQTHLNRNFFPPHGVALHQGSNEQIRGNLSQFPANDFRVNCQPSEVVTQASIGDSTPVEANMRPALSSPNRRARDRQLTASRPRSWHPSKSVSFDSSDALLEDDDSMRSPESGYVGSYGSQTRSCQQSASHNRRLKDWSESGDLRSAYKSEIGGPREIPFPGESRRSSRLSLSSTRSSETMSSSRDSLNTFVDEPFSQRPEAESRTREMQEQSKLDQDSPSRPQVGIVNQKRNLFERLSQQAGSDCNRTSYDASSSNKNRSLSPDESTHRQAASRHGHNSSSSSLRRGDTPRPQSAKSTYSSSQEKENIPLRKRSYDQSYKGFPQSAAKQSDVTSSCATSSSGNVNKHMRSSSNSAEAKVLSHQLSATQLLFGDHTSNNTMLRSSPQQVNLQKSPSTEQAAKSHEAQLKLFNPSSSTTTSSINSNPVRLLDTTPTGTVSGKRQERVFGVMSVGAEMVTPSVTPATNHARDGDRSTAAKLKAAGSISERDNYPIGSRHDPNLPASVALSRRATVPIDEEAESCDLRAPALTAHSASASFETSSLKGKYGSVWKTPKNAHRRSASSDFSTVLKDWTVRESNPVEDENLSVYTPARDEPSSLKETVPVIEVQIKSEPAEKPQHQQPDDLRIDELPSIMKSLQNAQDAERRCRNVEAKSTSGEFEKLRFWESSKRPREVERNSHKEERSRERVKRNDVNHNDWKSQFKEIDLDEPVDDACSPQDRYVYDIKGMSQKVLRVTSFTRKDLDVSPTLLSVQEKRKRFQYMSRNCRSELATQQRQVHNRSYSQDVLEETDFSTSRPFSSVDSSGSGQSGKQRPKSAGVARSANNNNRHAPVMRTTVAPPATGPTSYYAQRTRSLPRSRLQSAGSNDDSPSYRAFSVLSPPPYKTKQSTPSSVRAPSQGSPKKDTRSAIIDFISRKTGRSFESESSPIVPSNSPQRTTDTSIAEEVAGGEEGSQQRPYDVTACSETSRDSEMRIHSLSDSAAPSVDEDPADKLRHGFVSRRECDSFQDNVEHPGALREKHPDVVHEQTLSVTSGERSASNENLTDSGLDMSRASPSDNAAGDDFDRLSLSSTGPSKPSYGTDEHSKPPPRKHPKPHRQRYSNSSNSSSATTISTLSSFSSSSSTSIGRFPALGEEAEQLPAFPDRNFPSNDHSSSVPNKFESAAEPPATSLSTSIPARFDTGTYRVAKRKGVGKTRGEAGRSEEDFEHVRANSRDDYREIRTRQSNEALLQVQESVFKIIEKVKNSTILPISNKSVALPLSLPLPPPPQSLPLDDATEKILQDIAQRRRADEKFLSIDVASLRVDEKRRCENNIGPDHSRSSTTDTRGLPSATSPPPPARTYEEVAEIQDGDSERNNDDQSVSITTKHIVQAPPSVDPTVGYFSESPGNGHPPAADDSPSTPPSSSTALLLRSPNIALLSHCHLASSLQEEYPQLISDIVRQDPTLARTLMSTRKNALDYMGGILSSTFRDILEEGMRCRRRRSRGGSPEEELNEINNNHRISENEVSREKLPASSAYYTTSASKAKIMGLMKDMLAGNEPSYQLQETCDEINRKKVELILSIKSKLDGFHLMKGYLANETIENERLGKRVCQATKAMCSNREQEKYNNFVRDVDMIIMLLLSLSGRLARVENTIQTLSAEANKQEMDLLCEKRKRLTEQHREAQQLKENIDRRQQIVSDLLSVRLDAEQFADFEYFVKMKSALIIEQRELDDKMKLGEEQMQCLRDSLPCEWQRNLDKLLQE